MIKTSSAILLAAVLVLPAAGVRAQEDEEQTEREPSQKGPSAAAAARDKGYQAEADNATTTDEAEPSAPSAAPVPRSAPRSPGIGQGPASFSRRPGSSPGGGASAGGGISCEGSVPKLAGVQKKEISSQAMFSGDVIRWAMGPNEAVSYRFRTPSAGTAAINTNRDTSARSVPHLMTVSQTPCDFDVDKAMKAGAGPNNCYAWNPVSGGIVIAVAPSKTKGCVVKPDADYYLNIRFLSNPGDGSPSDSCQDDLPVFKSQNLKPVCGGIWHAVGNMSWKKDGAKR